MSDTIATYSFLPWLRQGLGIQIVGGASDDGRAVIDVQLELSGKGVSGTDLKSPVIRKVALYGPGDIQGIDHRAIFRTEPRNWITNFEPNYLASAEFYDEDFLWRYTPLAPENSRLQPWIALIVLEDRESNPEFQEGKNVKDKPLPFIEVTDVALFPPADQLWAWAHVHVNRSLAASQEEFVSSDMGAVLGKLEGVLNENPDLGYSRLLCPRKLGENRSYHAFVVPVFESGRRAGLGLDPYHDPALPAVGTSAWELYEGRPEPQRYPYYHRWYFRTGGKGDFESLVRLLKPQPADHRVGRRDLDARNPGADVAGLDAGRPDLGGVLKLGGALRVPEEDFVHDDSVYPDEWEEVQNYEEWAKPYPQPIQKDIAALINLADDYAAKAADLANAEAGILDPDDETQGNPDPVITPPLYGTWHAMSKRLLVDRSGEADPHPTNWLHELNLDPRFRAAAGFGTRVIQEQQESYMDAAWEQIGKVLEANRRIRFGQLALGASTIWYERHLVPLRAANLQGLLLLASPMNKRVLHDGMTVHQRLAESYLQPAMTSAALRRIIRPRGRLMRALPFSASLSPSKLLARVSNNEVSAAPAKADPPGFSAIGNAISGGLSGLTPSAIDALPPMPDFHIAQPSPSPPGPPKPGAQDSFEAKRFKAALKDVATLMAANAKAGEAPEKTVLDIDAVATTIVAAIDPAKTIPKRVTSSIVLPLRLRAEIGERFVEAMAYPEFDIAMYEPLKSISSELFLPNISLIAQNSITLLETNEKFIESYMVGLNHEFARELLWREYPTDSRGSYFRQFWDVSSVLNTEGLDADAWKEKLRDIKRLDHWLPNEALDGHNNRSDKPYLVLVIRGELLKRYPTAIIYAHHARWQFADGEIDPSLERRFEELTPEEEAEPPRHKLRIPLFEARCDPDIFFFGFDLDPEVARGGTGKPGDEPGWFFVIKQRPGEPLFGLDIDPTHPLKLWNDLSWADVQPGAAGTFIQIPSASEPFLTDVPQGNEQKVQHDEDVKVTWNSAIMTSAELAYFLYQPPVLVGVHASLMLLPPGEAHG